jgi:hypothetical protein
MPWTPNLRSLFAGFRAEHAPHAPQHFLPGDQLGLPLPWVPEGAGHPPLSNYPYTVHSFSYRHVLHGTLSLVPVLTLKLPV